MGVQTGGGIEVNPDGSGGGVRGLTQDEIDKLNSIEFGSQVNPKNVMKWASQDANTLSAVSSGEIGFIDSSDAQYQTGDLANIGADGKIRIANLQGTFGTNLTQPGVALDSQDVTQFLEDRATNGGPVILALSPFGGTDIVYVQTELVAKITDGYELTQMTWAGSYTPPSYGISWNIVGGLSSGNMWEDIINLNEKLGLYIAKTELAGHETDFYLSYNNAFVANPYKSGDWVLTTDTNGPPTTPNQVGQPDIATNSGVVAFAARTRSDADPDNLQWNTPSVAADYSSGDVIFASLPRDRGSYLKITLTSDGTLVGTGDSAYIWATADWDEVGNISNVADAGDYFTLSDFEPSKLRIRIPVQDVIGAVNVDGSNVSDAVVDAVQGDNETVTLSDTFRVDSTNVERYVSITNTNQQRNIRIRIPNTDTQNDTDLKRLLKKRAWVEIGDWKVDITTNATRASIGTSITYTFDFNALTGSQPTGSTPVKIKIVGADVHRGEIPEAALENETPNIAGNGAVNGQAWKYENDTPGWYDDLEWTIDKDLPTDPVNSQRHTFTAEDTHKLPVDSKEKTGQTTTAFFSNVATSIIYGVVGSGGGNNIDSFNMGYTSGDNVSKYTGMVAGDELWVIDTTNGTTTKLILTGAPTTRTLGTGGNARPAITWAKSNLQSPPASNWMTAGRAYDVVVVKPTKVIPLDTFDYRDGKWSKVLDGRYQRDTIGTVFPANPAKGQRLIVKADASTHLTASLGKFTKRGEATAAQFAAGDIAWVNLQGHNGVHIGFETTDDYQVFLDLTSGDEVSIIDNTTDATILTLNLTGSFTTYTFNGKPVVVIANSNYSNTISANPFTDERSYSIYPVEDHPTIKDEIWEFDGYYWVKEYTPSYAKHLAVVTNLGTSWTDIGSPMKDTDIIGVCVEGTIGGNVNLDGDTIYVGRCLPVLNG